MSHYILAIGGSGARCLEAFIHLCAVGYGPSEVTALLVDPDASNGNLQKTLETALRYRNFREVVPGKDYLMTDLKLCAPRAWSPFLSGASAQLNDYFRLQILRQQSPEEAELLELLYERRHRESDLNVGFRGQPSVGAAIFASRVDMASEQPWKDLNNQIHNEVGAGQEVKIFVFGSMFGGTGASGLPMLPGLLIQGVARDLIRVGTAPLLPYFMFPAPPPGGDGNYIATPQAFLLRTKEALRHYRENLSRFADTAYFVGLQEPILYKHASVGGNDQLNGPHICEMLAALAAKEFLGLEELPEAPIAMIAREERDKFKWSDVPDNGTIQPLFGRFGRMAYFFLREVCPHFERIAAGEAGARRVPWYVDFFQRTGFRHDSAPGREEMSHAVEYYENFLRWVRDLHSDSKSEKAAVELDLAEWSAFSNADDPTSFDAGPVDLMREGAAKSFSLDECWGQLSNLGRMRKNTSPLDGFHDALYEACQ